MTRVGSVQSAHIGVTAIEDDVLHLVGGVYRAVLEVASLSFALQSEREQAAIVAGFAAVLLLAPAGHAANAEPLVPAILVPVILLWGFIGCDVVFGLHHVDLPPAAPVLNPATSTP